MGKIKSKDVRRSAKKLTENGVKFAGDFEENKQILTGMTISKKLRNRLAGLLAKSKKQEQINA